MRWITIQIKQDYQELSDQLTQTTQAVKDIGESTCQFVIIQVDNPYNWFIQVAKVE